jgi:hypothetical protein
MPAEDRKEARNESRENIERPFYSFAPLRLCEKKKRIRRAKTPSRKEGVFFPLPLACMR